MSAIFFPILRTSVKLYVLGVRTESYKASFVLMSRATIVWNMTSCNLAEVTHALEECTDSLSSGGSIRLAQDSACLFASPAYSAYTSAMKMESVHSSETPVSV